MGDEVRIDDLEELWKAGAISLPQVAIQFSEAASSLHKTGLSDGSAFAGAAPELVSGWSRIRNMIQDQVFVKSYNNCVKSGNALANIAISISEQDTDNETDLKTIIKEIEDSDIQDDRPPSYVPDAPSSNDEHPSEYPAGPGDF